jgi:hypothetical protein
MDMTDTNFLTGISPGEKEYKLDVPFNWMSGGHDPGAPGTAATF